MTPATVHFGLADTVYRERAKTLEAAFLANPKRFKGKCPQPPACPPPFGSIRRPPLRRTLTEKYTTVRH